MRRTAKIGLITAIVLAVLAVAAPAFGSSTTVRLEGGTPYERAQVTHALAASAFNWSVLPQRVVVHIGRGVDSGATPGNVWLDANLLDAGRMSWGVVQHELAHQVDFLLLRDSQRAELAQLLHASVWAPDGALLTHASYGQERFASTLAWAFWQSPDNVMAPSANPESGAVAPAVFKAAIARTLGSAARKQQRRQR
jgi:hypothetical protein